MKKTLLICAAACIAFSAIAVKPQRKAAFVKEGQAIAPHQMTRNLPALQENTVMETLHEAAPLYKKAQISRPSAQQVSLPSLSEQKMNSWAMTKLENLPVISGANMLPTPEQASLHMQMLQMQAADNSVSLATQYVGSGSWALNGTSLATEWTTLTAVSNDTVLFLQLIPFSGAPLENQPVLQGTVLEGGFISLPLQKVAQDAQYEYYFAGLDENLKLMSSCLMLESDGTLITDAFFMCYLAFQSGELKGYKSAYYNMAWIDSEIAPSASDFDDASFAYTGFDADSKTWNTYTYVEGGKYTDGCEVKAYNLIDASIKGKMYEAKGKFQAKDSTITFPVQYLGTEYGFNLWLAAVDADENVLPLTLKVMQEGHVLYADGNVYSGVLCDSTSTDTTVLNVNAFDYWNTSPGLVYIDTLAVLAENPMPQDVYYGYGESDFNGLQQWETEIDCNPFDGQLYVTNLFPCDEFEEGWQVEAYYDSLTRTLSIPNQQYVDSFNTKSVGMYYEIFLAIDATGNFPDTVKFVLDENGNFVNDCLIGIIGFYNGRTLATATVDGWADRYSPNMAQWTAEYIPHGPQTKAGAADFMLNYCLQDNFWGGVQMSSAMPADAKMNFVNHTPAGTYNSLSWKMGICEYDASEQDYVEVAAEESNGETLSITTGVGAVYSYPVLTATDESGIAVSDSLFSGSNCSLEHIYAGCYTAMLLPSEYWDQYGAPMYMRAHLNNDLSSQAASIGNSINDRFKYNHLFFYQGKPNAPLYFEGITLPGKDFSASNPKEVLTCRIVACHRAENGRITLGDTLYTSQVSAGNVWTDTDEEYHWGYLRFSEFYQIDEDGSTYTVDYMQVNQEFCVELAWEQESSVQYTLFAEKNYVADALPNTYWISDSGCAEEKVEAGVAYYLTSAAGNTWVSFDNFMFGYLYTEAEKNINLKAEGEYVDIVVYPFMCSVTDSEERTTSLWLNEKSDAVTLLWDAEEDREESWLSADILDEYYGKEEDWHFTLRLQASALPAGEKGRMLNVKFEQKGAELDLVVVQGEVDPTSIAKPAVKFTKSGVRFNLAGQRVNANSGITVAKNLKAVLR